MHNEDNAYGLKVTNKRGDVWMSYGDDRYFDDANSRNRQIVKETLQASADEIAYAFNYGKKSDKTVYDIIVDLSALLDAENYVDSRDKIIPLFVYNKQMDNLLRRNDINRLNASSNELPFQYGYMKKYGGWIGWYGLSTLLALKIYYHPQFKNLKNLAVNQFTSYDGQLDDNGKKLLGSLLNESDKFVVCNYSDHKLADDLGVDCDAL